MIESLLPQNPFDGQIYVDLARATRWAYSKKYELWERQGIAEPPKPANETAIGTLSKADKAFLDTIQLDTPGSFSLIVDPKSSLLSSDGDGLISGNIKIVSDSFDVNCTVFTPLGKTPEAKACEPSSASLIPDGPQPPALNFSLSTNFLNSLVIDLPGPRGDRGPKGLIGPPGRHGYDFVGPPGLDGRSGVNGTTVYSLETILYEDFPDQLSDSAVADIALVSHAQGGKSLIFTKSQIDLANDSANRVAATLLQRYIEYPNATADCNNIRLSSWTLKQPLNDDTRLDLNILRLPTGAGDSDKEAVQLDSGVTLTQVINSVVDAYQKSLNEIDAALGKKTKAYIEAIDAQARTILSDLAGKLSEAEFSLPSQDFCLTFSGYGVPVAPDTGTPPRPSPTPPVPTPVPPVVPPPYTPTPVIPPLPPPPVVPPPPIGDPPPQPPNPPPSPPPVFPPVPTPDGDPPTPTPPTPTGDPPSPVTGPGIRNGVMKNNTKKNIASKRTVTLNNKSWFYLI